MKRHRWRSERLAGLALLVVALVAQATPFALGQTAKRLPQPKLVDDFLKTIAVEAPTARAAAATAAPVPRAKNVWVIIVHGESVSGGRRVADPVGSDASRDFMKAHLEYNCRIGAETKGIAQVVTMSDEDGWNSGPSRGLQQAIRKLNSGDEDVIFVYLAVHGVITGGKHIVDIGGDNVDRQDIVKEVRNKPARQRIVMTDTCSFVPESVVRAAPAAAPAIDRRGTMALARLLQYHTEDKVIDITAASPQQLALFLNPLQSNGVYDPLKGGGLLTRAFIEAAYSADPADGWDALFKTARLRTDSAFQAIITDPTYLQNPKLSGIGVDRRGHYIYIDPPSMTQRVYQDHQIPEMKLR